MLSPPLPGLIRPALFSNFDNLVALQSTRRGGVSAPPYDSLNLGRNTGDDSDLVETNLGMLCHHLDIGRESLAFSDQVHGTAILHATRPGSYSGFDAIMTRTPDLFPGIFTADCYPLLVHDSRNRASAAIHAGWKGSAGGITLLTLLAMRETFGTRPEECFAYVGTGISGVHYEVDEATACRFPESCHSPSPFRKGKYLLDLAQANMEQLQSFGIPGNQCERSPFCSWENSDLFYSYRRDQGVTGRMLSLIGLRC